MSKTDRERSGLLGTQQCARQVRISGLLYDSNGFRARGKVHSRTGHEGNNEKNRNILLFFLTSTRWCRRFKATPRLLYPANDPVTIVQDVG
jgi:hypothetical protein